MISLATTGRSEKIRVFRSRQGGRLSVFVGGHQAFRYKQELGKAGAIFLGDQIAQGLALIEAKLPFQN